MSSTEQLTPVAGWEASSETLTPESIRDDSQRQKEKAEAAPPVPKESTIIYCIFYLLGMGTLLPWNFFITADSYWNYKFRNASAPYDPDSGQQTNLQYHFFSFLSVASMVPNTIFLTLNAVFGHKMKQQLKLVLSLCMVIVFFVITTVLVPINADTWQDGFFGLTMAMVVILNIGSAVFQGGLFGVAAQFPARYLSAVISGQALGAVFACIVRVISIAVSGTDLEVAAINSALVYFILADVTLAVSIAAYVWMSRMSFYTYYTSGPGSASAGGGNGESAPGLNVWRIFLKIKWYALTVCLVFVVTLALFPAVTEKVNPVTDYPHSVWATHYFVPVCCFLLFNACDLAGRVLGGYTVWPRRHQWYWLLILALLRVAFVPLFMYCNVQHRHLTTAFNNDASYIVIMTAFGLTNGYITTLCMIYGPSVVDPAEQNAASAMMTAFLGLGLCLGSFLSNATIELL